MAGSISSIAERAQNVLSFIWNASESSRKCSNSLWVPCLKSRVKQYSLLYFPETWVFTANIPNPECNYLEINPSNRK